MPANHFNIKGLSSEEVVFAREKFGDNALKYKKENAFLDALKSLIKEPMIILLLVASLIYFVNSMVSDGIFMVSAIVVISLISLYQDSRSRNALEKLKHFTQPNCKVIRDGETVEINSEDLVVGDSLIIQTIFLSMNQFSPANLLLFLKIKVKKIILFTKAQPLKAVWQLLQ
jgi:Ca2+-transporting ATPase